MIIKGLVITMMAALLESIDFNNERQKKSNNGKCVKDWSQFHYQKKL